MNKAILILSGIIAGITLGIQSALVLGYILVGDDIVIYKSNVVVGGIFLIIYVVMKSRESKKNEIQS